MSKQTNPAAGQIAAALQRRIIDGTYAGGDPIRQADVAGEFEVSHIPVREALAALAQKGLVDIVPNRGAVVTRLSPAHCMELAEMRVALESLALTRSIQALTDKDIKEAERALLKGAKANALIDRAAWNWAFHGALLRCSDRPFLQQQIQMLWRHADRYLMFTWQHAHYEERSDSEHEALLDAVARRQAKRALDINRQHILDAASTAVKLMDA